MNPILARPQSGAGRTTCARYAGIALHTTIASTQSKVIDTVPIFTTAAVKWMITLINSDGSHMQTYQVFACDQYGTAFYTVYALVGSEPSNTPAVDIVSGRLELSITNNDPDTVTVSVIRQGLYLLGHPAPSINNLVSSRSDSGYIVGLDTASLLSLEKTDNIASAWGTVTVRTPTTISQTRIVLQLLDPPHVLQYGTTGAGLFELSIVDIGTAYNLNVSNLTATDITVDCNLLLSHTSSSFCVALPEMTPNTTLNNTIVVGDTVVIDTIPQIQSSQNWIISITTPSKHVVFECSTTQLISGGYEFIEFNHLGDYVMYTLEISTYNGRPCLTIHNQDTGDFMVHALRVPVSP